jgi:hypothetical protein
MFFKTNKNIMKQRKISIYTTAKGDLIYRVKVIWIGASNGNDQIPAEFGLFVTAAANCAEEKLSETLAVEPTPSSNRPEEFL